MSELTKIEWCDATFNPWEGCTKVSTGCLNCYAETRSKRFKHGNWGKGAPRRRTGEATWRKVRAWNRRPWKLTGEAAADQGGSRPRVFCASLADWLDDEVPIEWLADLLKVIHETPNLDWLLLTKRPENWFKRIRFVRNTPAFHLARAGPPHNDASATVLGHWIDDWFNGDRPPSNVWLGVSVEDQEWANRRIPLLLKISARVRFLSVEPLLGPIQLRVERHSELRGKAEPNGSTLNANISQLDWVIVGGESGPGARPCNVEWVRSVVGQCRAAGVACFVKQLGSWPVESASVLRVEPAGSYSQRSTPIPLNHPKGGDMSEWPEDLRVREFPAHGPMGGDL